MPPLFPYGELGDLPPLIKRVGFNQTSILVALRQLLELLFHFIQLLNIEFRKQCSKQQTGLLKA